MTPHESAKIAARVREIQDEYPRELIDAVGQPIFPAASLGTYFRDGFLAPVLATSPGVDPIEATACALFTLLGPGATSGPPPLPLIDEFRTLVAALGLTTEILGRSDRTDLVQLGLAYASGWKRQAASGVPEWSEIPWNGVWVEWGLIFASHLLAIRRTKLAVSVYGYASKFIQGRFPSVLDPREILGDAQMATFWFLQRPADPLPYAYLEFVYLASWDPAQSTLYRWCQIALEGGPKAWSRDHYLTNHFCHGLAFSLEEGNLLGPGSPPEDRESQSGGELRLAVKPVARSLCPICGHRFDYAGSTATCPKCDSPLLVVTAEPRLAVPEAMKSKEFRLIPRSESSPLPDHYIEVGMHPYNHLLAPARRDEAARCLTRRPLDPGASAGERCARARLAALADGSFKAFQPDGSPVNDAPGSTKSTPLWCK